MSSQAHHQRQVSLSARAVPAALGKDGLNRGRSWHACPRAVKLPSGREPAARDPHSLVEWNAFMSYLPGSETSSVIAEPSESR